MHEPFQSENNVRASVILKESKSEMLLAIKRYFLMVLVTGPDQISRLISIGNGTNVNEIGSNLNACEPNQEVVRSPKQHLRRRLGNA